MRVMSAKGSRFDEVIAQWLDSRSVNTVQQHCRSGMARLDQDQSELSRRQKTMPQTRRNQPPLTSNGTPVGSLHYHLMLRRGHQLDGGMGMGLGDLKL